MSFKNIKLDSYEPLIRHEDAPRPGQVQSKQLQVPKDFISVFCIIGFCLAIAFAITSIPTVISIFTDSKKTSLIETIVFIVAGCSFVLSLAFCIVGIVECENPHANGKGLGIAGMCLTLGFMVLSIFVAFFMLLINGIAPEYNGPEKQIGNFQVKLNTSEKRAYKAIVTEWHWDGNLNHLVIEVPDQYSEDIVIEKIGEKDHGPKTIFFTTHLTEDAPDNITIVTSPDTYVESLPPGTKVTYEELEFTLVIGKNIKEAVVRGLPYFAFENEDGSVTIYRTRIYVVCSPDNPYFYSQDGKLYVRSTGALCEEIYSDQ